MTLTDELLLSLKSAATTAAKTRSDSMMPETILVLVEEILVLRKVNHLYKVAFGAFERGLFGDQRNRSRDELEARAEALAAKAEAGKELYERLNALHKSECVWLASERTPDCPTCAALARWEAANAD